MAITDSGAARRAAWPKPANRRGGTDHPISGIGCLAADFTIKSLFRSVIFSPIFPTAVQCPDEEKWIGMREEKKQRAVSIEFEQYSCFYSKMCKMPPNYFPL